MTVRNFVTAMLLVFAVVSVYGVCHTTAGDVQSGLAMTRRAGLIGLAVAAFWSASIALRKWMSLHERQPVRVRPSAPPDLGPGRFRVVGIDHQSKMELTEFTSAESEAQARFKVELKGVEVIEVRRA